MRKYTPLPPIGDSGEVEKYGTGLVRIRERLEQEAPEVKLSLRNDSGAFWVSLGSSVAEEPVAKTGREGFNTPPNTPLNTPPITSAEMKVLRLLKEHSEYSSSALAKELYIGRDTVKDHLARLKSKGVLIREGSLRSGRWVIVPELLDQII